MEKASLQTITVDEDVKVGDGKITFCVESVGVWVDPAASYSKGRIGMRMHPQTTLLLEVPVEGVTEGDPISPRQAAEALEGLMASLLPACKIFIEAVNDQFGYVEPPESDF